MGGSFGGCGTETLAVCGLVQPKAKATTVTAKACKYVARIRRMFGGQSALQNVCL